MNALVLRALSLVLNVRDGLVSWWRNHKVKTLGAVTAVFGALHNTLPQVQGFLKPQHYGYIFLGVGAVTALFGYLARPAKTVDESKPTS